jgi:uncharacterized membrane protein YdjX (TVP38/TMEM64 family)
MGGPARSDARLGSGAGHARLLAVLGIYVVAAVALVPQTVLKVAAGGLFGSTMGVVVASLGSTLGGLACFLIARYVARGAWMQRLKSGPRMTHLDEMSREKGTMLVVISRLVPIFPGNVLNYALGLTQLRTFTFTFWSWLTMVPGIVVLVVGTDAILRGIAEGRVPWGLAGIVIAMLVLLVARHLCAASPIPLARVTRRSRPPHPAPCVN